MTWQSPVSGTALLGPCIAGVKQSSPTAFIIYGGHRPVSESAVGPRGRLPPPQEYCSATVQDLAHSNQRQDFIPCPFWFLAHPRSAEMYHITIITIYGKWHR